MPNVDNVVETRIITAEEAEICANEKIQYMGNIQPHGFLLVVDSESHSIVQHSDNFLTLINAKAEAPVAADTAILGTSLHDWIKCETDNPFQNLLSSALQIFAFGSCGRISSHKWECMGFVQNGYVSLEFFPATSKLNSYELILSLDRMVNRIKESKNVEHLFHILTQEFQKHAEYDRVMLYRFLPDWTGEVIAESVSNKTEIKFLGMRFPAEDIPKQARELYKNSALRIMADVDAEPANLVPSTLPCGKYLDQSISMLRGMSLMHVAYLRNMGIKASMSIALMSGDRLWGLVAFHHYSAKVPPNHLVSEMKASCELFADIVISHLHPALNLEMVNRSVARKNVIESVFHTVKASSFEVVTLQHALQTIYPSIDKTFLGVCVAGECFFASVQGDWKPSEALCQKIQESIEKTGGHYYEADALLDDTLHQPFPDCPDMAGIIALRSKAIPELFVFFGAKEVVREITWGGRPKTVNIVLKNGERTLEPRGSFELWREKVCGRSDEWTQEDRLLLNELMVHCEDYVFHSKSELVKSALHKSSYTDTLTGLPNRRYLEKFLSTLTSEKITATMLTVYFIDLDNFKRINDFLGHQAGDRLLKVISERIKHCVRPDDIVARLGGDEFVVVVKHMLEDTRLNEQTANNVANKIILEVSRPVFENDQAMITTPSIGAVMCDPLKIDFNEVLKQADIAMYRAKNAGKNCIHFFNDKDQSDVNYEVQLEIDLRDCLARKKIQVFYQAKVDKKGQIVGAEALARWEHPELGFVSPDVFIALAEKNNFIVELGAQILDVVCQQLVIWKPQVPTERHFAVAVNVSPVQLLSENFEALLRQTLTKYGLSMSDIRLEITETLFMKNFDKAKDVLESLRSSGITVSLDDFGTGYSSLSYLWKLPIDEVKIDQSFVASMTDDEESFTMVEGIISLCKKLKLNLVAEGVEEKVQLALLTGMGCDDYQGYYFARPVAADQFHFQVRP